METIIFADESSIFLMLLLGSISSGSFFPKLGTVVRYMFLDSISQLHIAELARLGDHIAELLFYMVDVSIVTVLESPLYSSFQGLIVFLFHNKIFR